MQAIFTICALVGGTALVLQFILSLIGMGSGDGANGDFGDVDIPDGGADFHGHAAAYHHGAHDHGTQADHHHGSASVVKILTFQTVIAFLAFFGLAGLATLHSGHSEPLAIVVAAAAGAASMFALAYVMHGFFKLQADPTVRLYNAVGAPARVYLKVPAASAGAGKVTVVIQGREVELAATTPGPELPTGAAAVVTRLIDGQTLEVVAAGGETVQPPAAPAATLANEQT